MPRRRFSSALALSQLQTHVEEVLHNTAQLVCTGLEKLGADHLGMVAFFASSFSAWFSPG